MIAGIWKGRRDDTTRGVHAVGDADPTGIRSSLCGLRGKFVTSYGLTREPKPFDEVDGLQCVSCKSASRSVGAKP